MSADATPLPDDRFSLHLAACDEALAAGRPLSHADIPLELLPRLEKELAWCQVVRQLLPRRSGDSVTVSQLGRQQAAGDLPPPPTRVGRYAVVRELGRGSFGVVFLAHDPRLGRDVALKVPRAEALLSPELRARFQHEARAAAGLDHPHLVPVYEAGEDGVVCYIVSAYCPGPTLADWLRRRAGQPVPPLEAARLVLPLAGAVAHAHGRGVLHRDLKPANILMAACGSAAVPKITDFGLAKIVDAAGDAEEARRTHTGAVLGTPAYMAPEQAGGHSRDAGPAADVYALGAILYECLTGRPPFQGDSPLDTLLLVRTEEPPAPRRLRPDLPRDLETICLTCLRKEPGRRYPSASALEEDLRRFLAGEPIVARPVGPAGRLLRWCRRKPALAVTLALAVTVCATVAGLSVWRVVEERDRYRAEKANAEAHLYQALVGEARALRLARAGGYREEVWSRLRQARDLDTPARDLDELRREAAACLGDFVGLEPATWRDMPKEVYAVALALAPRGDVAALGLTDGSATLRRLADGAEVARLRGHAAGVFAVAYAPDGERLATADDKGTVKVWGRGAGHDWLCAATFSVGASGRPNYVHAVSLTFGPDGRRLFVAPRGAAAVTVWDLDAGRVTDPFAGPQGEPLYRAALSRDGKWLAAALDPGAGDGVLVWDVAARRVVHRLAPGLGAINDVVFSPGGKHLACACVGGVAVFDAPDFRGRFFVRGDAPNAVAFSPDEQWLAIPALHYSVVRLWDVRGNCEVALLKHSGEPHAVGFSPDGGRLVAAGADLTHVWDLRGTGEKLVLPGHDEGVCSVAYSADGTRLASAGANRVVQLFDGRTGARLGSLGGFRANVSAALAPDGRTLAVVDESGPVTLWDVAEPRAPRRVAVLGHEMGPDVWRVAFSRGGDRLAAAGGAGITLWRRETAGGAFGRGRRLTDETVSSLAFSPDGRKLAWAVHGAKLRVCDADKGTIQAYPDSGPHASGLAFLADGEHLALVNRERAPAVEVWDLATQARDFTVGAPGFGGQGSFFMGRVAALSDDDAWLAVQGPTVSVWDVGRRRLLLELPREHSVPSCLAWSPDRERLTVGSGDGGLVVWHLPSVRAQLARVGLDW